MMRSTRYQIALIALGIISTVLFAYFLYKEVFPEYKIFQNDYIALENFRSTYTGEAPPVFNPGVKQLVFEREDKGPERVDRCISCHLATEFPSFSPTKIKQDEHGNIIRSSDGKPVQIANDDYVWGKLDEKIHQLRQQAERGEDAELKLKEASKLEALKTAKIGEQTYDVVKVLAMHPLIGNETRPFEFHPLEEYGCTSCHSGNGRALTLDKAHGPVFDDYYEAEFVGQIPKFIEEDKDNDPRFAKVFNHKPGDALIFQTTPILVGHLIEARCIQCHRSLKSSEVPSDSNALIDQLLVDYYRGQDLYISQSCYACHRIAGVARGGVGPDLTYAGNSYPWYLKESIVWPQADLPSSQMPNYRLDPSEVEDLMTYLLAQKGRTKSKAEIDYKVGIQEWEEGKKLPLEKAVPPSKIEDLSFSMSVFATEGCAACHVLEGFSSDVGFAVEKEKLPIFQEQEWFESLFPEGISGKNIVKVLEKHGNEIDKRIANDVREGSLLERIEKENPGTIQSFYSNFRFASRAKNHEFKKLAMAAKTPEEKTGAALKLKRWQDLVHRVLMMYIEEYGLGRQIGPKVNWSGIYRSDEWLMEHFKNPSSHVPRSLMPIMPFDESKFYALTYMLDVLGKRNRDAVRNVWEHEGFNPESAYAIFCSQCHGTYLQGNGPVAEWIYPIPKNLRNAEFLKNLTRKKAIESITHGVAGTPMAPWGETPGETPEPKPGFDGIPILQKSEIERLVDWLFTSLPGGASITLQPDIPKWKYSPQDVADELKREIKPKAENKGRAVNELFDVVSNPSGNEQEYFIKQDEYTKENIEAGEQFFDLNCAACHGADADGSGIRASIMNDAKPRMLTNFDWLNSHDDLYLLRSIKYGVPGTAMTPWGDLTSSLQRIQLVIFIRSLSEEKEKRVALQKALYSAFEKDLNAIENVRKHEYQTLEKTQIEYDSALNSLQEKFEHSQKTGTPLENTLDLYKTKVEMNNRLIPLKAKDQLLIDLKNLVVKQRDLTQAIGNELISAEVDEKIWNQFLKMVDLKEGRFKMSDHRLTMMPTAKAEEQIQKIADEIAKTLSLKFPEIGEDKTKEKNPKAATYRKLKERLLSGVVEDRELNVRERMLTEKINNFKE